MEKKCLFLFKRKKNFSLLSVSIVIAVLFLHLTTASGETIDQVGNWLKYQVDGDPSIVEMKCTVIGKAKIFGIEGVAVIENEFIESDYSEFEIELQKEINGSRYVYRGAMRAAIGFLAGPVGTKWSEIERTGTELYEIVAIEDIQVPAGFFPGCCKVANWKISHYDDSLMSYDERWWHPGTGYVKLNMHIGLADEQHIVLIDYNVSP